MSKIRFNEDWFHFFHSRYENKIKVDEKYLKDFIFQYKDTQITDFSINVNGRISSFPSKVLESFTDKYTAKTENGKPVDYTQTYAALVYDIFIRQGLDMYKIWIDALREIDIRPWISVRMNDCHCNQMDTHLLMSEFAHQNAQLKRVRHRVPDKSIVRQSDDAFYWDDCFDYAKAEVRNQMRDYITEVLERYDIDGLELDFTRELPCFAIGFEPQGRAIMTQFLTAIKELTYNFSKIRGHEIQLSVLVNAMPQNNYDWGLDVVDWARKGLVESVIALPRWKTVDTDIPVRMWKDLLSPYHVAFAAGNQILTADCPDTFGYTSTLETTIGAAAVYRSFGADFTYIYNHMDMFYNGYPCVKPWLPDEDACTKVLVPEKLSKLFKTAGDKDMLIHAKRRHFLSFHDFPMYWEKQTARLPIYCDDPLRYEFVRINVGEVPENAKMYLLIGVESQSDINKSSFSIRVNNAPVSFETFFSLSDVCSSWKFKINNPYAIQDHAVIEITTAKESFKIVHMEIMIEPEENTVCQV